MTKTEKKVAELEKRVSELEAAQFSLFLRTWVSTLPAYPRYPPFTVTCNNSVPGSFDDPRR